MTEQSHKFCGASKPQKDATEPLAASVMAESDQFAATQSQTVSLEATRSPDGHANVHFLAGYRFALAKYVSASVSQQHLVCGFFECGAACSATSSWSSFANVFLVLVL